MQHQSVQRLFKEQVNHYAKKDQAVDSSIVSLVLEWLRNLSVGREEKKLKKTMEICEFGGGAGQLLNEIRKSYQNANFTNVEIIDDYKRFLVSKKVRFILGSILDSNFPNEAFDVIIIRDILHHLVGEGYKETLNNQRLALMQLKHLVRPGGVIFIEELTNESEVATRIIYYLSWLNTKIGVHIPSLFVNKNVIVAFLTSDKLLNMCNQVFGKKNIEEQEVGVKAKWYFTLLHFLGGLKKITITIKK